MTIYYINPQTPISSSNIFIIMSQLILTISNNIANITNPVILSQYINLTNTIINILGNYLKIYKFYSYSITNIYLEIYNQNINTVVYIQITLGQNYWKYKCSYWNIFNKGDLSTQNVIISQLNTLQYNELINSIIKNELYFVNSLNFIYNTLQTFGILYKSKINICNCNNSNTQLLYIIGIYWN